MRRTFEQNRELARVSEELRIKTGKSLLEISEKLDVNYKSMMSARYKHLQEKQNIEIPKNLIKTIADEINGHNKFEAGKIIITILISGEPDKSLDIEIIKPDVNLDIKTFETEIFNHVLEKIEIRYGGIINNKNK